MMIHRLVLILALLVPAVADAADMKKPAPPAKGAAAAPSDGRKSIGKFDDWEAVTYQESGQTVCYAGTRAQKSSPAIPNRGEVILWVTERHGLRDIVAIGAGMTYPDKATVTVQVDQSGLDFYTDASRPKNAFARDNKATVAAFQRGSRAIARSPGTKDVTDTFSLKGFGAAYAAIVKACPN